MATIRAQRLLNNVVSGAINSSSLETALADSATRADFQQIVNEQSKARMIARTDNGAAAVGQSVTALTDYLTFPTATVEFGKFSSKMAPYMGTTVAASSALMSTFLSSRASLVASANSRALGTSIYTSPFAKDYASTFLTGSSTSVEWNMGYMQNIAAGTSSGRRFFTANGATIISGDTARNFNEAFLYTSVNGGTSYTAVTVDGTNPSAMRDVAYGNGRYVLVGAGANAVYTSTDGFSWTRLSAFSYSGDASKVSYDNGRFVMLTKSANYYSDDGITWSTGSGSVYAGGYMALEYVGNSTWIALQDTSSGVIHRSTNNGATWSTVSTSTTVYCVASDKAGRVVLGAPNGQYQYSNNYGQTWAVAGTMNGLSASWDVWGAVYYGGNFIFSQYAVGYMSYASVVGGASNALQSGSNGIYPFVLFNPPPWKHSMRVVDNRLFVDSTSTVLYTMFKGQ